ISR
ncbi:tat (twin-arginine translocation) pathway signal sequence domain protein, partial [Vibrio parahaemolyticus V-223/04]